MRQGSLVIYAAIGLLTLGVVNANADDTGATITVSGHAKATYRAEIMRMTVTLSSQGANYDEAMSKLKPQEDSLKAGLPTTGVDDKSITFSDPTEGDADMSQQQRMIQQLQMSRPGAAPSTQPSVTVHVTVTAEWVLPKSTGADAFLAAEKMQEKIKAAIPKPAASATGAALTPEQQELAEEMAAAQRAQGGDSAGNAPQFVYAHKLSEDERTKVLADAVANAQAQAKRLASAVGGKLGALDHISTTENNAEDLVTMEMQMYAARNAESNDSSDSEATGSDQGKVEYSEKVTAAYKLQ